ncbi:MAG TPA: glycosyltransferase family 2 protein [Chitinispirillaceae bacterium]|nr:glycosyltransferase family 2 protein [Chitinispirillaceae bacterium]
MIHDKKVFIVLPAYNAALTLEKTCQEIPRPLVDEIILVDDASKDDTVKCARAIGIKHIICHEKNRGYGGNQKTCYDTALSLGADIVIMLHPDYQYTPKLITAMASIIGQELYQVVFGSRILGKGAIRGGMPPYKYVANRALTLFQNILMGQKLSEYHTGYRAFSREVLTKINYHANSDDFVFDNEMIAQIFSAGYDIAEVTCPTRYFKEASSINFVRSVKYGLGVLGVSVEYALHKRGIRKHKRFELK